MLGELEEESLEPEEPESDDVEDGVLDLELPLELPRESLT